MFRWYQPIIPPQASAPLELEANSRT
jgi:hypothetical protein